MSDHTQDCAYCAELTRGQPKRGRGVNVPRNRRFVTATSPRPEDEARATLRTQIATLLPFPSITGLIRTQLVDWVISVAEDYVAQERERAADTVTLTVGKRYKVLFDDCCVRGTFTAVLKGIGVRYGPEFDAAVAKRGLLDDDDMFWVQTQTAESTWHLGNLVFDNGVVLEEAGGCEFEEA